jgi:hypothetical protein
MNGTSSYITLLDPISQYFSIPNGVITTIIVCFATLLLGIAIWIYTRSYLLTAVTTSGMLFAGAFIGFIPMFIPICHFLLSVIYISYNMFNYKPSDLPDTPLGQVDYWEAYGNRLKEAYSAKFGGENKGFNDEVNNRIVIMQKLKHGFTNTIAYDWLKRMKKFTEAK